MTKKEKDLIAENKMLTAQVTALREELATSKARHAETSRKLVGASQRAALAEDYKASATELEADNTALLALLRACADEFGCWGGNKDGSGSHYCSHCDNVTDRNDTLRQQIRVALVENNDSKTS